MKEKLLISARLLFGLMFLVFGLNGFFNFIPIPAPSSEGGAFLGALAATGFIFPIVKAIEVLVGISMLTGRFTALSLVVITPILVVIVCHHLFLDPAGLPNVIFLVALHVFLTVGHWKYFREVLTVRPDLK